MDPTPDQRARATRMLTGITVGADGDPAAFASLLYDEMRQLARQMMASERANHTLQPTALVHEAYLRLINSDGLAVESQDHFFLIASRVMRNILIDHARGVNRIKRGGDRDRVPMTIANPASDRPIDPGELLALDEAVEQLRALDERKAKVVELRFFGGLDEEMCARILGIARSTASSDWRFARAWLMEKLGDRVAWGNDG